MPIVIKSVKQSYQLPSEILQMMEIFRQMTNECIRIGLENDASSMKQLSKLTYNHLANYNITTYYKLCAISHAAGILANRKKSIRRGFKPRQPYAKKPLLISCYGFTVDNGILKIPLGNKQYYHVSLNTYTKKTLSSPSLRIHSFTFAVNTVSISYSTEVTEIKCAKAVGVDRNLRNLTVGNDSEIVHYDLSRAVDIVENTRSIIKSFKRNDVRIRKTLFAKYGRRRKNRISQMLHRVSKAVVQKAVQDKTSISFEKLTFIRRLYQHGNGQGNTCRGRMNSWSFAEIKRIITYKAAWEGVPVIRLSKSETRGTSQFCPQCGKKITQVDRLTRQLFCAECKKWMDRDVVAAMNISIKGLARFASSKGLAGEAMVQESGRKELVILRVDASKLGFRRLSRTILYLGNS